MEILRILIGGFGAYIFASLATVTVTLALSFLNKMEAISLASMLSFIFCLAFILYSFSNVKLKNLVLQFLIICISLFLINTYLLSIKG